jgi:hypothetical protein
MIPAAVVAPVLPGKFNGAFAAAVHFLGLCVVLRMTQTEHISL